MRRKLAAILPLYLAGVLLLAFAVLPHHHHDSFLCFNATHCVAEEDECHTSHRHTESPEKGDCIQYLFRTEQAKILSRHLSQGGDETPFPLVSFYCILPELLSVPFPTDTPIPLPEVRDDKPYRLLLSSHKLTRGPPQLG